MRSEASEAGNRGGRGRAGARRWSWGAWIRPGAAARKAQKQRATLESLEARLLLATVPTPIVVQRGLMPSGGTLDNTGNVSNESDPTIVVDRYNPDHLAAVWVRFDTDLGGANPPDIVVEAAYSNNGGQSWNSLGTGGILTDPNTPADNRLPYNRATDPSAAFDADGNLYVLMSQTNADGSSGALVLNKYNFSGNAPVAEFTNRIVYRWSPASDRATNPSIAVDNGLRTFTDPDTGQTQNNPFSGNVYIAWASGDVAPANNNLGDNYNPNRIWMISSSDGGAGFGGASILNDNGNFGLQRNSRPRIAVSQGTAAGSIEPGLVTVVWDDFGSGRNASPPVDIIKSDRTAAGINHNVTAGPVVLIDGVDPGGGAAHTPGVTDIPLNVNITDPRFTTLSDLDVRLVLTHPAVQELQIDLIAPDGTIIQLLNNQVDTANAANQGTGVSGANLGILNGISIGTTFDQQATRNIVDFTNAPPARGAAVPFIGHFRPNGGNLNVFNGQNATQLNGQWTLRVTDHRAGQTGSVNQVELKFRSGLVPGPDIQVSTTRVIGSITDNFARGTAVNPTGIGPNAEIAVDNTLGSFSAFQGRIYVTYVDWDNVNGNPADNTEIFLRTSDDGGLTWSGRVRVNDDNAFRDGFSEADVNPFVGSLQGRPQLQPKVAVDQATGMLVMSWYDTRYDAARVRVTTTVTASIDGGASFSEQIFVNQPRNVVDAITGSVVTTEPIPDNQSSGNGFTEGTFGFGDNQGLAVHGGRIFPIWSSNLNGGPNINAERRLDIATAIVVTAAGPRIVDSSMGVVGLTDQFGNIIDPINNTTRPDGTPVLAGFDVVFDRPVDPATFTPDDVRVFFRDATAANLDGGAVPVLSVVPLSATRFRINVVPQSGVGTYSYTVGPEINDRIRTTDRLGNVTLLGNLMDQNANAIMGETPTTGIGIGDVYAAPRPTTNGGGFVFNPAAFFAAPYDPSTLPLILSGPRLISSRVPGSPSVGANWAADNLALDRPVSALDVTFDRDMAISSFTGEDVLRIQGPAGELIRPTPFVGVDRLTAADDRPIPDQPTVGDPLPLISVLEIPGDGTFRIADLDLRLDLTHPNTAQLTIELEGPDGTRVTLLDGIPGAGFTNTVLDDDAPLAITAGSSPYTGRFRTLGSVLNQFDGKELRGTWRLIVTDNTNGQTGTLNGWSLEATPLPNVAPVFNATANPADPTSSRALSLAIPNGGTTNSTLIVPGGLGTFTIADLNVTLDITHSRPQDLTVVLIAPNGTQVPLFASIGGPLSRDFRNTTLDDEATIPVNQAPSTSFTGIYTPQGGASLSALDGLPINGTWTLRVTDAADPAGTAGTLNSWSLTATPENPSAAAARTFRVSFPTQKIAGSYIVSLGADIESRNGDPMDNNTNAGLDLLRGTAVAAPTVEVIQSSVDAPKPLVNGGVTTSILTVSDSFVIADLNLRLNINHTLVPDLTAVLIAPDGTRVTLFDAVGAVGPIGSRQNFTNTLLDDQATTPIQNGAAPFFGRFNPQQPLGVFNNTNASGTWTAGITDASGGGSGTLLSWSLEFQKPVPNTGLGEPVADRSALSFRVFRMDPSDPLSGAVWTPVGPASANDSTANRQGYGGRVSALAVDPSDPSGNTVYLWAASGGIWKTNDFLTTKPGGPTWVPLTDFGPTFGLNIGSIAVFARNNDPNQSIILAATGEASGQYGFGSTNNANARGSTTQGVGFLRSTDGGATWELLDSTDNSLPFAQRNHAFANNGGTAGFKVTIDPTPTPAGGIIAYAAMSGPSGGLWRSLDAGITWQLMRAGNATDVILDEFSGDSATGNLNIVYAAFSGEGVFSSPNRGQSFNLMTGQIGVPQLRDADVASTPAITVANLPSPNGGGTTRISLARPAVLPDGAPNAAVRNILYQGWLYAAVASADGNLQGVYLTKDFGQTWTRLQLPNEPGIDGPYARPSNDLNNADYFAPDFPNPQYTLSLVVDPNNPEIVYLGGSSVTQTSGLMRIDASRLHDAHALIAFHHSRPDGGLRWLGTNAAGAAVTQDLNLGLRQPARLVPPFFFPDGNQYTNLIRDPGAPFLGSSAILVQNIVQFNNDGAGVRWTPLDQVLLSKPGDMVPSTSVHQALAIRDPLTGNTRLLFGNDQGVFTGVDQGNGQLDPGIGNLQSPTFSRVGNLQISQLYQGASQPTTLAARLAGALFHGMAQGIGFPNSSPDILSTGTNWWLAPTGGEMGGSDVATDQQGRGTVYQYKWPSLTTDGTTTTLTEFFQVNGVPRTFGLIQTGGVSDPQWPTISPIYEGLIPMGRFAVNPLNGDQVVISSNAGRIFATTNEAVTWAVIGNPGDLDGTYAPAVAYGAPDPTAPGGVGNLGNFIYAGTIGGNIYVTRTGGGSQANAWQRTTPSGLGSSVTEIITSPDRGSRAAYAVTLNGVYYTPDSINTPWQNISGNLFSIQHAAFGNLDASAGKLDFLTSIKADWRYAIPEDFSNPNSPTHPLLYVSGNAGVYRSLNNGQSWELFPTLDDGAPQSGGYLPSVAVTDLDMAIGVIDPTNGRPIIDAFSPNVLLASTFGRGAFAIRLAPQVLPNSLAFAAGSDSGSSATDRITNVIRPTIEGRSAQTAFGSVITVQLIDFTDPANPVIIGTGTTDSSGQFSIQVIAGHFLADGTTDGIKSIGVQAIDQAGTRGNIVLFEFELDTVAPVAPPAPDLQAGSDTPGPGQPGYDPGWADETDNITSITNPFFDIAISGEPDTTILSLLRNNAVVNSGPVNVLSPTTAIQDTGPAGPAQPDGVYGYRARLVDLAGNISELSPELLVTIDTTAPSQPAAPVLEPADDTGTLGDNTTSNTRPRFNGVVNFVGTIELLDGAGNVLGSTRVNGASYTVQPDLPFPGDGTYTLRVRGIDIAGNVSVSSNPLVLTIDTAPPIAPQPTLNLVAADDTGLVGDDVTANVRPRFEGNAAANMRVELIQLTPGVPKLLASGIAAPNNRYLLRPTVDLPEGDVTLQTRVIDPAGNVALSNVLTVRILTEGPADAPTLRLSPADDNLIPGDNVTTKRRPVFEGTTEPGVIVELVDVAGTTLISGTADANGDYALVLPSNLTNGVITLLARARDIAGNAGPLSSPLTVRIVTAKDDYDGDGKSDAMVFRSTGSEAGTWHLVPSSGGSTITTIFGQAGDIPISGDFDGDGRADLALFRPSKATFYIQQSTAGLRVQQLGWAGVDLPAAADYDGDGRTDIAIYSPVFGHIAALRSSAGGIIQQLGVVNGTPVSADYDGDFKDDFAVFNPRFATWTILQSSNGTTTTTQFGQANHDVPIPGDFDRDGKADLAVFRPSTATWFIRRSTEGGLAQQFGWAGNDIPTPADYDGDGQTDLSVYRGVTTGQYLTRLSGGGVSLPLPFSPPQPGDLPVQAPLGYKISGGTQIHLGGGPGGTLNTRSLGLGGQPAVLSTPGLSEPVRTPPSAEFPDFTRGNFGRPSVPMPILPTPQPVDPGSTTDEPVLGPWATRRERLLQFRRERLAARLAARQAILDARS